jgi:hypothetical protein
MLEDEMEGSDRIKAQQMRSKFRVLLTQKIKEYVDEAEHLDGLGYWLNFETVGDAVKDFVEYINCDMEAESQEYDNEADHSRDPG